MISLIADSATQIIAASDAGAATSEGGPLAPFGWHPWYFLAQLINFFLVIFVLKKFAFGPIQEILEQRRNRIAEGEEKLKRIERQLAESEETTAAAIAKANEDAQRLITEAKESAAALSESKAQEAVAQAQLILSKAEAAAKAERAQIASELKKEFGRLVTSTTAQVTGKVLTDDDQSRINQEALAKVES
ncbi:F0F1 ATP synthase subunit B [Haloferula rosea]|uniref:ATP synthase subunit b n=1 Tax=Haloferula rosea TaxID=490093 RepID=A0A934RDX9_9BACT|nr:F0F1 ATP synthase subunit B [Haloferula rosea]MBK1827908.1 F0F1 ATP synthase subunit B [Haloferula rosea]